MITQCKFAYIILGILKLIKGKTKLYWNEHSENKQDNRIQTKMGVK